MKTQMADFNLLNPRGVCCGANAKALPTGVQNHMTLITVFLAGWCYEMRFEDAS